MHRLNIEFDFATIWPELAGALLTAFKWSFATVGALVLSTSGAVQALGLLFLFNGLITVCSPVRAIKAFAIRATFTMLFVGVMSFVYHRMAANLGMGGSFDISTVLIVFFVGDELASIILNLSDVAKINFPIPFLKKISELQGVTGVSRVRLATLLKKETAEDSLATLKEKLPPADPS